MTKKPMTSKRLREIMHKQELRQKDVAWICGVSERRVRTWASGDVGIPQYADLLLTAYERGLIDADFLISTIAKPAN